MIRVWKEARLNRAVNDPDVSPLLPGRYKGMELLISVVTSNEK